MKTLELNQMEQVEGGRWGRWTSNCTWGMVGAVAVGLALLSNPLGWMALTSVLLSGVATEAALISCIQDQR